VITGLSPLVAAANLEYSQSMSVRTRVIEYQVLSWADLDGMGDLQGQLKKAMGVAPSIGILRCVTASGRKVTLAGGAKATKEVVRSGAASHPDGIAVANKDFPVLLEGWPFRIREG
jgi:hypothetical protein